MSVEHSVEWKMAGETEGLGENLPQFYFVHHKSHNSNPSRRSGKPATNCLNYGTAMFLSVFKSNIDNWMLAGQVWPGALHLHRAPDFFGAAKMNSSK
jgi:hypothetical protein